VRVTMTDKPKARRGFAAMTPEKQREIASMGGRSVPPDKRTFASDSMLARDSGRLGGLAKAAKHGIPDGSVPVLDGVGEEGASDLSK
jgi:general stress protein YciG